ncbi:HNH endonuclease [Cellvibrio sp. PSBB023]|nr:HNH endonuclease [Cellvibrio sp. PSBB023]
MRPIRRNTSPRVTDFTDYTDAKPDLVARLGPYCSFCERRVMTQLAVEHVQPKGLPAYAHLIGRWNNFLLACVNCNSTKNKKDVVLSQVLLPDRDNTFVAFEYQDNGTVTASAQAIASGNGTVANNLLSLTGLDKAALNNPDENGKQVALDRVRQRMEALLCAQDALTSIRSQPENNMLRDAVVKLAKASGFFSVWMTVFNDDADMRLRLINSFPGTAESGCFDLISGNTVSPSPNPDALVAGGKI